MNFYFTMPLVAWAMNLVLALLVFQRQRQSAYGRLLFFLLLSMAGWGISIYAMRSSETLSQAYDWERWTLVALAAISIFYFHFALAFTRRRIAAVFLFLAYLVVGLSALAAWSGWVVSHMQVVDYGYAPVFYPLGLVWMGILYSYVLCALLLAVNMARTSPSAEERNRARYIAVGVSFAILGTATDALRGLGLVLYPMGIIGNIIFALFTTVAIIKYQLVDLKIIARQAIPYFLAFALLFGLVVGLLFMFSGPPKAQALFYAGVGVVAVCALILYPVLGNMQRMLERSMDRRRYETMRLLRELVKQASATLDLDRLARSLESLASQTMETDRVYLLVPLRTGTFRAVIRDGPDRRNAPSLEPSHPVVNWLRKMDRPLSRDELHILPQLQAMTAQQLEAIRKLDAELFVPVKTREELSGILALGKKNSGQPYTDEDMGLISTVASQIGMAVDNARLYSEALDSVSELQKLEQMKSDFMLAVSHDLKTPLTVARASTDMAQMELGRDLNNHKLLQELVEAIDRSLQDMQNLINHMLELQKAKSATLELHLRPANLRVVIGDVLTMLAPLLATNKLNAVLDPSSDSLMVNIDPERIKQVLLNLLTNAMKFSPQGSEIHLGLRQEAGKVVTYVHDSGPGIPLEEQQWIFQPYYQVVGPEGKRPQGTGLGLTIAKQLTKLHGGHIWVESQPGQGTTFLFSLPLATEEEIAGPNGHGQDEIEAP